MLQVSFLLLDLLLSFIDRTKREVTTHPYYIHSLLSLSHTLSLTRTLSLSLSLSLFLCYTQTHLSLYPCLPITHTHTHQLSFSLPVSISQQSPLVLFSLFCIGFFTKELVNAYSADYLFTLVTSQLVKKHPFLF